MHDNLARMRAFLDSFQAGDWEGACAEFCHPDFEIREPPGLPQSGIHRGRRAPIAVSEIYRGIWEVEIGEQSLWAARDDDLVFSRYLMTWTSRATGKTLTQPVMELNRFRDGKLAGMEVFMSDPIGLMATLEED